jgi:hypothetical protein
MITSATDEFIEKARNIHGDLYDYSLVVYVHSKKKIIIICKKHGNIEQTPAVHIKGHGCRYCCYESRTERQTSNTIDFILKAEIVHNNTYDYTKVNYVNARIKIIITCRTHGDFEQTPDSHLKGRGCSKCFNEKRHLLRSSNTVDFIKKANIVHNNTYDYLKVIYKCSHQNIVITCRKHGDFELKADYHLQGSGCPDCSLIVRRKILMMSVDEFISRANIIHNNTYDYSNVKYDGQQKHVSIICKIHGEFNQRAGNHLNGNKCPRCSRRNYSKQQILWLNFLSLYYNIDIQHAENDGEYKVENIKADGFCKARHCVYEFNGDYWHGNPGLYNQQSINTTVNKTFGELYQKTIEREQRIVELGFNLVTIWETEWLNLNKFVKLLQKKFRRSRVTRQT